jgi:hypothetical protein
MFHKATHSQLKIDFRPDLAGENVTKCKWNYSSPDARYQNMLQAVSKSLFCILPDCM